MAPITFTKHHGLGNDFLIAVDPAVDISADDAVSWCDRRRGVGADGLIVARPDPSSADGPASAPDAAGAAAAGGAESWTMTLWNADGSRAELSGNGLRCLGQALVLHRGGGGEQREFRVRTDAGERRIQLRPHRDGPTDQVAVEMGKPVSGAQPFDGWGELGVDVARQAGVDMGNPHLVVLLDGDGPDDLTAVDLAAVGPMVERAYPDGMNIEVITVADRSRIDLRVWERGAHITEACGSGACAAAWAAHQWDLVDDRVEVVMPGGTAVVELIDGEAVLTGPATFIAVVRIERR